MADNSGEEEYADKMRREVDERMQAQLNTANFELSARVNARISELDFQYRASQEEMANERREQACNVHAENKALQLISRLLGVDWRDVYPFLFPLQKDEWDQKMNILASKYPNKYTVQAFKMLMMYKQEKGDAYNIELVLDALRLAGRPNIAEEALAVLYSGGEDLLEPVSKHRPKGGPQELPYHNRPDTSELPLGMKSIDPFYSALEDYKLVLISKALGESWQQLGQELQIPQENLKDYAESEDSKTSAFQMLYNWRENSMQSPEDDYNELIDSLNKIGCSEIVESMKIKKKKVPTATLR